jgi:hypothetical protein
MQIGDVMPDGSIYAGLSPDTNNPMYATVDDANLTMTFNKAKEYASKLEAYGRKDWRLPTKSELKLLFHNKEEGALSGTFNPAGFYWSSEELSIAAWGQRFSDGLELCDIQDRPAFVRYVRCPPRVKLPRI